MKKPRMTFPIEYKILIPFVCISLIAVVGFCVIMYHTEYQIKLQAQTEAAQALVGYITADIDAGGYWNDPEALLQKYEDNYTGENLFIYGPDGALLFARRAPGAQEIPLVYSQDNRLGWSLYCSLDRGMLLDTFIEEQKYMILAAVALLLVIVECSVLVAHNISNPIRRLSETCVSLSLDHTRPEQTVQAYTKRRDEVGQLAAAFDTMVERMREYTQRLHQVMALNESIVENLPLGLVVYGREGQIVLKNGRAEAMLARAGETDGQNRELATLLNWMVRREAVLPETARLRDGAGQVRDYEFGVWKLQGAGDGEVLCTIDDVTYQRHMEEKISQDEKLAYTGRLAADVAHEVRNPLAGIRAGLQVVGGKLQEERDQTLCKEMVREVDRMNLLIENMLNLSRRRESQRTAVSLNAVCQELQMLYSKVAQNKGIELRIRLDRALWVYADEGEVRQVLVNLVNNSIRALGGGGWVQVDAAAHDHQVWVTVSDNGPGMTQQRLEGILRGEGGGLGLSIVRRLMEQNGGSMALDSAPGQGTEVALRFQGGEHDT